MIALLPAAGHSRRMGQPKLALLVHGRPLIEQVITTLLQAGVDTVVVVLAPHVAFLAEPARCAGAHVLLLEATTPDMRATVELGLEWIAQRFAPENNDDWLLVPADHPALDADVIAALRAARQERAEKRIFIPVYEGQRGHPVLLRWSLADDLRGHPTGEGINRFLRARADEVCEVPVATRGVLEDLDTPEDWVRFLGNAREEPKRNSL